MRLKEIREARGITQRQAAIDLNMSPTVYNRYEKGLREPSNVVLIAIANYFNVTIDELLGREKVTSQDNWDVEAAFSDPDDDSIRIMARGMGRMSPENRQKLLDVARTLFKEDFDEKGNKK